MNDLGVGRWLWEERTFKRKGGAREGEGMTKDREAVSNTEAADLCVCLSKGERERERESLRVLRPNPN